MLKKNYREIRFLSVIFAFMMMSRFIGLVPSLSYTFINIIIGICLLRMAKNGILFYRPFIYFFIYIIGALAIANPSPVFRSWERLILFIILLFLVSPVCQNDLFRYFRLRALSWVLIISIIVSIGSFFCYFLGINLMNLSEEVEGYLGLAGAFGGLTKHSMLLGPVSGISICALLYWSKRQRYAWILIIPCIGSLFFSASRGAVLATIISVLFILYLSYSKTVFIKRILSLLLIGMLTFPLWKEALSGLQQKQDRQEESGIFDSRTNKIEARVAEFRINPIIGIGFASIDPNGLDFYNRATGVIEPGSSWLAVLSMLGVFGFLFIVYIIVDGFQILSSRRWSGYKILIGGLLLFFIVHMMIEGYIFAAGSPLCFIFWILIGIAIDHKYGITEATKTNVTLF